MSSAFVRLVVATVALGSVAMCAGQVAPTAVPPTPPTQPGLPATAPPKEPAGPESPSPKQPVTSPAVGPNKQVAPIPKAPPAASKPEKADRLAVRSVWKGMLDNQLTTITVTERALNKATIVVDPAGAPKYTFLVSTDNGDTIKSVDYVARRLQNGSNRSDPGTDVRVSIALAGDGKLVFNGEARFNGKKAKNHPVSFAGLVGEPPKAAGGADKEDGVKPPAQNKKPRKKNRK